MICTAVDGQHALVSCGGRDPALDRIENIEALAIFFRWLPQKDQELFKLRLVGVSTTEIAKKLGLNSRTIRNRIDRILEHWQQSSDQQ